MAVVYPLANGNWSTVANWYSGGVAYGQLPLSTDDVYMDNKTLTLDVDITIANLYFTARSGGTAGGLINCSTTKTVTCTNIQAYGSNNGINFTGTTGTLLTVNANFLAGTFNDGGTSGVIKLTSSGNVNVNGNLVGSTTGNTSSVYITGSGLCTIVGNLSGTINIYAVTNTLLGRVVITGIVNTLGFTSSGTSTSAGIINGVCIPTLGGTTLINTGSGTITVNGTQTAVGPSGVYAITNGSVGIININGDCLGALSTIPSSAYVANNNSSGIININGNVTARSVSPATGTTTGIVNNATTGTINVSTNVSGGTVANTIGISNSLTGTINVTGNITGGTHATNTPAIYSTTAGTIDITGSCSADAYPALFSTSTTANNRLRGNVLTKNGIVAAYVWKLNISPSAAQAFTFQDTSNANRLIATSNISPGAPGIADVRFGTVYGSSSEYTGTLRVPNPNTVSLGVLTDNTTGTMLMTPADFWGVASSGLTTSGSIGERLKNASTVQSNGDQLAAYIV